MDRRRFLTAVSAAGTAGLAGCSSPTKSDSGRTSVPKASVGAAILSRGGWEQVKDWQEKVISMDSVIDIEGYARTTMYEDKQLRKKLRKGTMGNFDATIKQFFTTNVELNPDLDELPWGIGKDRILSRTESNAKKQFKNQMKKAGLTSIQKADEGQLEVDTGETARAITYRAQYEYPKMSVKLSKRDKIIIPSGKIQVNGLLATWHNGRRLLVAGGAVPGENFQKTIEREVTELVSVTVNIDMEITPEKYWQELVDLVTAVK